MIECIQCHQCFDPKKEKFTWDEHGLGYSARLVECPYCQQLNIEYIEDPSLDVNNDERFYDYRR